MEHTWCNLEGVKSSQYIKVDQSKKSLGTCFKFTSIILIWFNGVSGNGQALNVSEGLTGENIPTIIMMVRNVSVSK